MSLFDNHYIVILFTICIVFMLVLDLGVFNKKAHAISNKEAATWSVVWIGLSMCFSLFLFYTEGFEVFSKFQSAYWIEKALSMDNLFVFILIFQYFDLEERFQHRVLFWGILGAIIFRAIFIFLGFEIVKNTYLSDIHIFHLVIDLNPILILFGLILVYAGLKAFINRSDKEKDFGSNLGVRLLRKILPITDEYDDGKFFIRKNNVVFGTKLLVVLAVIEASDLIFAVDSIPAIFSIAPDRPDILFMSNIFAILGLRSLYFLLSNSYHRFSKLKHGIAIILLFIGLKMIFSPFFESVGGIPPIFSLGFIFLVMLFSIILSLTTKQS